MSTITATKSLRWCVNCSEFDCDFNPNLLVCAMSALWSGWHLKVDISFFWILLLHIKSNYSALVVPKIRVSSDFRSKITIFCSEFYHAGVPQLSLVSFWSFTILWNSTEKALIQVFLYKPWSVESSVAGAGAALLPAADPSSVACARSASSISAWWIWVQASRSGNAQGQRMSESQEANRPVA